MTELEKREIAASVWGEKLYGSGFLVRWLEPGDRFIWPLDKNPTPQVYVYAGKGWYRREGQKGAFRTGVFRSCIKVESNARSQEKA